ncbi:hypothetical protein L6452_24198 [Arctium lappa]|uniref:Uncharacterized protein n=1 Tax=Arctium lappa TaxID=4217 RepID=A0ACB9A9Z2_ARCLA|nr:hypothetical protein L6452_24198 [Arctium lappa]
MQAELNSLMKREVFGPVVRTPEGIKPVGHKWVFIRKHNEKNEIVRYKARLVAQGFSQRPGIDYEETYSFVVDATTFRYLISMVVQEGIDMRLMDVVTAYLYGSLDTDIYMKLPEGLKLPESCKELTVGILPSLVTILLSQKSGIDLSKLLRIKKRKKDNLFQVFDDSSEEERTSATGRYVLKTTKEYNDEDRRMVGLDSKVRTIIAQSLPDEVYQSLVSLKTAKDMWSTLCVLYEGTNEVKKSKKISLGLGKPSSHNPSMALISDGSKKSACIPRITYPSDDSDRESHENLNHSSEAYLSEADDEGENPSVNLLTEEMGMLANFSKFRKNSSNKFQKSRIFSSSRNSLNKSKEDCYACGKKGHFASECRSNPSRIFISNSSSSSNPKGPTSKRVPKD